MGDTLWLTLVPRVKMCGLCKKIL